MKHNPKYYKTIVELTKIQIIFIAITVFISIADFDIITQHFFTSILSHEIEYFKTIKDIIIHLLLYYLRALSKTLEADKQCSFLLASFLFPSTFLSFSLTFSHFSRLAPLAF